jgi:hypothetical protein
VVKSICNFQDGLVFWIRDEKSQLSSRHQAAAAEAVSWRDPASDDGMLTKLARSSSSGMASATSWLPRKAHRHSTWTVSSGCFVQPFKASTGTL